MQPYDAAFVCSSLLVRVDSLCVCVCVNKSHCAEFNLGASEQRLSQGDGCHRSSSLRRSSTVTSDLLAVHWRLSLDPLTLFSFRDLTRSAGYLCDIFLYSKTVNDLSEDSGRVKTEDSRVCVWLDERMPNKNDDLSFLLWINHCWVCVVCVCVWGMFVIRSITQDVTCACRLWSQNTKGTKKKHNDERDL